jgi:hypothetical protein
VCAREVGGRLVVQQVQEMAGHAVVIGSTFDALAVTDDNGASTAASTAARPAAGRLHRPALPKIALRLEVAEHGQPVRSTSIGMRVGRYALEHRLRSGSPRRAFQRWR